MFRFLHLITSPQCYYRQTEPLKMNYSLLELALPLRDEVRLVVVSIHTTPH